METMDQESELMIMLHIIPCPDFISQNSETFPAPGNVLDQVICKPQSGCIYTMYKSKRHYDPASLQ